MPGNQGHFLFDLHIAASCKRGIGSQGAQITAFSLGMLQRFSPAVRPPIKHQVPGWGACVCVLELWRPQLLLQMEKDGASHIAQDRFNGSTRGCDSGFSCVSRSTSESSKRCLLQQRSTDMEEWLQSSQEVNFCL